MKEKILKFLKQKTGKIIVGVALVVVVLSIILIGTSTKAEEIDTTFILSQLKKASELTTAELTYTGFSEFKDDGIIFINKSDFKMVYKAKARAGIDMEEVKIKSDRISKTVVITIPKAKVLDVKVEADSIKYFDSKFSLFNVDSKKDAANAIALAEKEAEKELKNMGILKMADTQAEALMKGLIQDLIPKDYEIEVKIK